MISRYDFTFKFFYEIWEFLQYVDQSHNYFFDHFYTFVEMF